jgi:hypothetical protein
MSTEKNEKPKSDLGRVIRESENPNPHAIKSMNPNAHGTTNNLPITPYVPPKNNDKKK